MWAIHPHVIYTLTLAKRNIQKRNSPKLSKREHTGLLARLHNNDIVSGRTILELFRLLCFINNQ